VHGQGLLEAKLERHRPGLVIFTFNDTAKQLPAASRRGPRLARHGCRPTALVRNGTS
jgi:hypothetical protein